MKRDFNLIRRILIDVENMPPGEDYDSIEHLSEYDPMVVYEHIDLLLPDEANFVKGMIVRVDNGEVAGFRIERLTWQGHDFLDASKDDSIWKKANDIVLKPGVAITFDLLLGWLKNEAKLKLGLP